MTIPGRIILKSVIVITLLGTTFLNAGNIVSNPSFEESRDGQPVGWGKATWGGKGAFELADFGHTGSCCVALSSVKGADISWQTTVPVKPFAKYRLSGWIKTEAVKPVGNNPGRGAQLNIHNMQDVKTAAITGNQDWTRVEVLFETAETDNVIINCLFGGWGFATGKAWFDDVKIEFLSERNVKPHIIIDANNTREPMSKYIYSQFIEHLGRCIYGGIWAEMLQDRKFWYSVKDKKSPWKVIGDPSLVKMTTKVPLNGKQNPEISLESGKGAAGISQDGLGLVEGKRYVGHFALAGAQSACPIKISLAWGQEPGQKKTIVIKKISDVYQRYPFSFMSEISTDNGILSIVGSGKGSFMIGTASIMPSDNIYGMRADTIKLLKELNAPLYRWPGGNFVSGYNWSDGIGDPDLRPPKKNPAWRGVEHNDFGIHEFIRFCHVLGAEPLVVVNTGRGKIDNAVQEVMYANSTTETALGRLRAMNGDPEPFNVKWWGIGNEMYGGWQLGHMPLENYIKKNNLFVEAMRAVSPGIKVIVVGAVGRWSEGMLAGCADYMDLISEHFYCQERKGLLSHINQIPNAIRAKAEAHRRYRKTIKAIKGKDIRIAMDEWNYWYGPHLYGELGTRYFLKDALGIAAGINEYSRNTDIIFMANYAQTVNVIGCIKTNKTSAEFATTGLVLKMYRNNFGTIPMFVGGNPGILNIAANWTRDKKFITISIINPTRKKVEIPFELSGAKISGSGRKFTITGADPMAYNAPGETPQVRIIKKTITGITRSLTVEPISATIFKLGVQKNR